MELFKNPAVLAGALDVVNGYVLPQPDEPEDVARDELSERIPELDWDEAFAQDYSVVEWLAGKVMERGQQVALVGDGKCGKSLFVQDWMRCAVAGMRFLGDTRREPLKVLYFDRENSQRDIVTRMISFGAGPADLKPRFSYRMFPAFSGSLDASALAAAELMMIVEQVQPDVVVLDTVSRFIEGNENDANTWLSLYRRVHAGLKARGIACIRIDHFGKDSERGSRGSSAKSQDVDAVWELSKDGDEHRTHDKELGIETIVTQLKLHRTHTRTGLGQSLFWITRVAQQEKDENGVYGQWLPNRTRHSLAENGGENVRNEEIEGYVDALIEAGLTQDLGRRRLGPWATEHGVRLPGKATVLTDIAAALRARLLS